MNVLDVAVEVIDALNTRLDQSAVSAPANAAQGQLINR